MSDGKATPGREAVARWRKARRPPRPRPRPPHPPLPVPHPPSAPRPHQRAPRRAEGTRPSDSPPPPHPPSLTHQLLPTFPHPSHPLEPLPLRVCVAGQRGALLVRSAARQRAERRRRLPPRPRPRRRRGQRRRLPQRHAVGRAGGREQQERRRRRRRRRRRALMRRLRRVGGHRVERRPEHAPLQLASLAPVAQPDRLRPAHRRRTVAARVCRRAAVRGAAAPAEIVVQLDIRRAECERSGASAV